MERLARREVLNTTPSGISHFHYDNDNNVLAETTSTGAVIREYIWLPNAGVGGGGKPVAVVDRTTATQRLFWVTTDHLDRPVMMTDSTRAVVWRANYKPFGEVISITGSATLDQRFPGQFFQIESGLTYNWHRHMDATTNRSFQPDPLGFVDGPSVYGYALQNPLKWVDRDGRAVWVAPIAMCVRFPALCATGAAYVTKKVGDICGSMWNEKSDTPPQQPINPPNIDDFKDPNNIPAGWQWKGKGEPGSREGAYNNPGTKESLHDDRTHPPGKPPHWTYTDPNKTKWDNDGSGWVKQ
jgi:RHS repeat-associated protein